MKRLLVIFLIGFLSVKAIGQPSVDIGIFGGTGTYLGDITQVEFQESVNPAYGGFVRFNFNPRYGLRFNVLNGTIGATGIFESEPWTFGKNVLDFSLLFEFNYLKYIVGDKATPWSTFLFWGAGVQHYQFDIKGIQGSEVVPTIPFGLGFKYNLSKRWGIGLEGSMRKTFSDKLDNLDDPYSYIDTEVTPIKKVNYTDKWHNNDWTAYIGVHLVYKMIYGNREWELRTPRSKMIDWGIWNSNRKE